MKPSFRKIRRLRNFARILKRNQVDYKELLNQGILKMKVSENGFSVITKDGCFRYQSFRKHTFSSNNHLYLSPEYLPYRRYFNRPGIESWTAETLGGI